MATWNKDPVTGEKTLATPATAPKARCCVEVEAVKAALPPAPPEFIMPTLLTEAELETAYQSTD